ncbi:protein of unknown function [Kyrpidia spormannii]|uniref:Uncharacterized protein n=1 Tax=Kyrpidia spormannii TaxID=2055160 RepID=A0ACA8ZCP2_9BACL|nr:protein of unknown function [Kyrpidia spormannii]
MPFKIEMCGEWSKETVLAKSVKWLNPGKTQNWQKLGIDLVMDRREAYCFYDMSGKRLNSGCR